MLKDPSWEMGNIHEQVENFSRKDEIYERMKTNNPKETYTNKDEESHQ